MAMEPVTLFYFCEMTVGSSMVDKMATGRAFSTMDATRMSKPSTRAAESFYSPNRTLPQAKNSCSTIACKPKARMPRPITLAAVVLPNAEEPWFGANGACLPIEASRPVICRCALLAVAQIQAPVRRRNASKPCPKSMLRHSSATWRSMEHGASTGAGLDDRKRARRV